MSSIGGTYKEKRAKNDQSKAHPTPDKYVEDFRIDLTTSTLRPVPSTTTFTTSFWGFYGGSESLTVLAAAPHHQRERPNLT